MQPQRWGNLPKFQHLWWLPVNELVDSNIIIMKFQHNLQRRIRSLSGFRNAVWSRVQYWRVQLRRSTSLISNSSTAAETKAKWIKEQSQVEEKKIERSLRLGFLARTLRKRLRTLHRYLPHASQRSLAKENPRLRSRKSLSRRVRAGQQEESSSTTCWGHTSLLRRSVLDRAVDRSKLQTAWEGGTSEAFMQLRVSKVHQQQLLASTKRSQTSIKTTYPRCLDAHYPQTWRSTCRSGSVFRCRISCWTKEIEQMMCHHRSTWNILEFQRKTLRGYP